MAGGSPDVEVGRVRDVNLITATKLSRVPLQRLGLLLSKSPEWLARAFDEQSLERQLKTFDFLHTARWVAVQRFPRVSPYQRRERFGVRWLLYTGNFDGEWRPYFHTFMEAMGEGVYDIWGQSIGYPKFPAPGTANALQVWLDTRIPPSQHYYVAYPHVTTSDIRAALRVRREVCSLAVELTARDLGASAVAVVTRAFDAVAARVRHCVQPIGAPPWPQPPALANGSIRGFVAIFPLRPGHEPLLKSAIEELPIGSAASPFRRVPGTHFARLALLHRDVVGRHPRTFVPLRNSYLLFAADVDGEGSASRSAERYARSMYRTIPDEVRAVWSHCLGFEDVDDDQHFGHLAARCRCRILREFIDYPEESLRSILTALASQRAFVELVRLRARGVPVDVGSVTAFLDDQPRG